MTMSKALTSDMPLLIDHSLVGSHGDPSRRHSQLQKVYLRLSSGLWPRLMSVLSSLFNPTLSSFAVSILGTPGASLSPLAMNKWCRKPTDERGSTHGIGAEYIGASHWIQPSKSE
jgi:hypothetical protein